VCVCVCVCLCVCVFTDFLATLYAIVYQLRSY
jgi:hypothetical protein